MLILSTGKVDNLSIVSSAHVFKLSLNSFINQTCIILGYKFPGPVDCIQLYLKPESSCFEIALVLSRANDGSLEQNALHALKPTSKPRFVV